MAKMPPPVLPAVTIPATRRRAAQSVAFCPWEEAPHYHSAGSGNRAPHCTIPDSGFRHTGYTLEVRAEAESDRAVIPAAPFAGRRKLRLVMEGASLQVRAVVLRHLLAAGKAGASVQKTIHGYRVWVFGPATWSIEAPEAQPGEGLGFLNPRASGIVHGEGLSSLAAALHGVSRGVAAARMLQAVTLDPYDPQALSEIAAAIDAWDARERAAGDRWWQPRSTRPARPAGSPEGAGA